MLCPLFFLETHHKNLQNLCGTEGTEAGSLVNWPRLHMKHVIHMSSLLLYRYIFMGYILNIQNFYSPTHPRHFVQTKLPEFLSQHCRLLILVAAWFYRVPGKPDSVGVTVV